MPSRTWKVLSSIIVALPMATLAQRSDWKPQADYEFCSAAAADRLSSGPDSAEIIVKSIPDVCDSERRLMLSSLAMPDGGAVEYMEAFDTQLARRLRLRILEKRAGKEKPVDWRTYFGIEPKKSAPSVPPPPPGFVLLPEK